MSSEERRFRKGLRAASQTGWLRARFDSHPVIQELCRIKTLKDAGKHEVGLKFIFDILDLLKTIEMEWDAVKGQDKIEQRIQAGHVQTHQVENEAKGLKIEQKVLIEYFPMGKSWLGNVKAVGKHATKYAKTNPLDVAGWKMEGMLLDGEDVEDKKGAHGWAMELQARLRVLDAQTRRG